MTEDHHEKDENKMPDKDKTREMGSSGESISPWMRFSALMSLHFTWMRLGNLV